MSQDAYLQMLIVLVERGEVEVPITINVGGTLLRGDLIPQEEFFEQAAAKVVVNDPTQEDTIRKELADMPGFIEGLLDYEDESTEEDVSRELKEVFREQKEQGKLRRRTQALESSLHLRNVEVLSGGAWVEFGGVFWRGSRAAVDGFWVGRSTEA